jgi:hypothetical protein
MEQEKQLAKNLIGANKVSEVTESNPTRRTGARGIEGARFLRMVRDDTDAITDERLTASRQGRGKRRHDEVTSKRDRQIELTNGSQSKRKPGPLARPLVSLERTDHRHAVEPLGDRNIQQPPLKGRRTRRNEGEETAIASRCGAPPEPVLGQGQRNASFAPIDEDSLRQRRRDHQRHPELPLDGNRSFRGQLGLGAIEPIPIAQRLTDAEEPRRRQATLTEHRRDARLSHGEQATSKPTHPAEGRDDLAPRPKREFEGPDQQSSNTGLAQLLG